MATAFSFMMLHPIHSSCLGLPEAKAGYFLCPPGGEQFLLPLETEHISHYATIADLAPAELHDCSSMQFGLVRRTLYCWESLAGCMYITSMSGIAA